MENYIKQSGVVPYFFDQNVKRVILVTAKNDPERWICPKGHIEPNMTPQDSAAKEAIEEAGLIGDVENKIIGSLEYSRNGKKYFVEYFPMKVEKILDEWQEKNFRTRISIEKKFVKRFVIDEKLLGIIDNV